MLFHFFENASARRGPDAFNMTVEDISKMPYIYAAEIFLLAIPIAFHSLYGLFIRTPSRPDVVCYSTARNWAYLMQRVSGLIAFFYIIYHVLTTRIWALFVKGDNITWLDMNQSLSHVSVALIYIVGIVAITYHFSNGLWSFCITWGVVTSRSAQQKLAQVTMVIFFILCVIGLDIFSAFIIRGGVLTNLLSSL